MKHICIGVTLLTLLVQPSMACAMQQPRVNKQAQVVQDFRTRVDKYVALRNKADDGAPPLEKTAEPAKIHEAQVALQKRIQAAGADWKHGAIFSPEISARFRAMLRPEVRDRGTKEAILDDNPGNVTYKVMAPYPDNEPFSTVPPNVLASLPELPKDIEYRFVGKHLILRDARANLIIDYLANAMA
jgi:hypothetical protein